jgi:hypothetical protein
VKRGFLIIFHTGVIKSRPGAAEDPALEKRKEAVTANDD